MNENFQNIRPTTAQKVRKQIKCKINWKKTPGLDLITGEIFHRFPRKALIKLIHLTHAAFRLK